MAQMAATSDARNQVVIETTAAIYKVQPTIPPNCPTLGRAEPIGKARHHRSIFGPATRPISPAAIIPSEYQLRRNVAVVSGQ